MLLILSLVLIAACGINDAQDISQGMVYFPEEIISSSFDNKADIPSKFNLTEIRNTTLYESYVEQIISESIAKLMLAINKVLIEGRSPTKDNIVFGPVSISAALALIHLGANGKTFKEITDLMGFAANIDMSSKFSLVHEHFGRILLKLEETAGFEIGQQVNLAQGIFVQNNYPIRKLYHETAQQLYESETYHVDFQERSVEAQKQINDWISKRTNGKIQNILADTPTSETKVIIATAMYFKALWEYPFFEGITARRPFYSNGRHQPSTAQVDMMANGGEFPYFKDNDLHCEIIGFPYKGNASVMYVVMPFKSDIQKLKQFESSLTANHLQKLADSTKYTGAVVLFPRMKMESTIDLRGPLRALGLKSLFDPKQANLALLSPGEASPQWGSRSSIPVPSEGHSVSGNSVKNVEFVPVQNTATISPASSNRFTSSINSTPKSASSILVNSPLVKNGNQASIVTPQTQFTKKTINLSSRVNTGNTDSLENLRRYINEQSTDNSYQNPGLYADKIIHKVYMDITETGTEAAATTYVALSKDGSRINFRADSPFLFFIRHEGTKAILFWGSVNTPTPNYS